MRARWRRELDETDRNLTEIQRRQSMRLSHATGMHRKVPRQSCPSCKEERDAQWQKQNGQTA